MAAQSMSVSSVLTSKCVNSTKPGRTPKDPQSIMSSSAVDSVVRGKCDNRASRPRSSTLQVSAFAADEENACPHCKSPCWTPEEYNMHLEFCGKKAKENASKATVVGSSNTDVKTKPKTQTAQSKTKPTQTKTEKAPQKKAARGRGVKSSTELIERDPAESKKVLSERVSAMIGKEPSTSESGTTSSSVLPESRLRSRSRSVSSVDEVSEEYASAVVWNLSERLHEKEQDDFYVAELVPPISPKKVDSLRFRSLTQIPGYRVNVARQASTDCQPSTSSASTENEQTSGSSQLCFKRKLVQLVSSESEEEPTATILSSSNFMKPANVSGSPKLSAEADEVGLGEDAIDMDDDESNQTMVLFDSSEESGTEASADPNHVRKRKVLEHYIEKLRQKTKAELGSMLSKIGVKPLPIIQAVTLLTNVKVHRLINRKPKKPPRPKAVRNKAANDFLPSSQNPDNAASTSNEAQVEPTKTQKKGAKKAELTKLTTDSDVESFMIDFISKNTKLHESLLRFEVLYIKPFLKDLKETHKVSIVPPTLLMDFLDSQSIVFSQHDEKKPRSWGGKKKSPKPGAKSPRKA